MACASGCKGTAEHVAGGSGYGDAMSEPGWDTNKSGCSCSLACDGGCFRYVSIS